jgi:gamma-glutamyltranspeptidase/glutathione hydrolase
MTMEDLAAYEPTWAEPLHVRYHGYDLYTIPEAFALAGGLHLLAAGRVSEMGHYGQSPKTLYWMLRILRAVRFDPERGILMGGTQPSQWQDKAVAAEVWQRLQDEAGGHAGEAESAEQGPGHSSSIVAVDRDGNIAAVLHSINTVVWGEGGLVIGGVSIPDAASFQQYLISATGPGRRMPTQTEPVIVLKDGRPMLATSAIGSAIDYDTIRVLFSALDFGMNPRQALDAAGLLAAVDERERVTEGEYSDALIKAVAELGLELEVVDSPTASRFRGSGVMLAIDPETRRMTGCASAVSNGGALAY